MGNRSRAFILMVSMVKGETIVSIAMGMMRHPEMSLRPFEQ